MTLRSYIARFNKEALSIDEVDDKILVVAFTNGLWKGKFLFSLYKNDSKTMSDMLYRATEYMKGRRIHDKTEGGRWQELETLDGQKLHHPWNTKHLRNYYQ